MKIIDKHIVHVLDLMDPMRTLEIINFDEIVFFTLFSLFIVNLDKASINKSKYSSFQKQKKTVGLNFLSK